MVVHIRAATARLAVVIQPTVGVTVVAALQASRAVTHAEHMRRAHVILVQCCNPTTHARDVMRLIEDMILTAITREEQNDTDNNALSVAVQTSMCTNIHM